MIGVNGLSVLLNLGVYFFNIKLATIGSNTILYVLTNNSSSSTGIIVFVRCCVNVGVIIVVMNVFIVVNIMFSGMFVLVRNVMMFDVVFFG